MPGGSRTPPYLDIPRVQASFIPRFLQVNPRRTRPEPSSRTCDIHTLPQSPTHGLGSSQSQTPLPLTPGCRTQTPSRPASSDSGFRPPPCFRYRAPPAHRIRVYELGAHDARLLGRLGLPLRPEAARRCCRHVQTPQLPPTDADWQQRGAGSVSHRPPAPATARLRRHLGPSAFSHPRPAPSGGFDRSARGARAQLVRTCRIA